MSVRVRYAPSPTGFQHIGGARTALFNYFFARSQGGKFLLRVEDTDQERFFDEALDDLYQTMDWLGIEWDEGPTKEGAFGPYTQSERTELYREFALQLVESGKAYYCYCSSARLERIRKIQESNHLAPGYDRHCRHLTDEEANQAVAEGTRPVIRLKVALEGSVTVHDELLGDIITDLKDISPDPILLKSDGFPTYHLANIVDDHLMEITHVMRAQEWLPSAPLHKILYEAYGWQMPKICHLPMVMGSDGLKLSKRHGATSVKDFKAKGYLREAVINYISLLGWSYDDSREFFTMDELCDLFTIQKMSKSPAIFDYKKLDWFNGQYIRRLTDGELKDRLMPFLLQDGLISEPVAPSIDAFILKMMPLIKERMQYLTDGSVLLKFFFTAPELYNIEDAIPKKMDKRSAYEALSMARNLLEGYMKFTLLENEERFRAKAAEEGLKINQLLQGLRVAITGSTISPPLFDSIYLLGEQDALERVDRLLALMAERE